MAPVTWKELADMGWKERRDDMKQVSYVRPNNMKVNSKGDLSKEDRVDIGDLLFPGKQRRVSVHPPVAAAGTSAYSYLRNFRPPPSTP